MQEPKKLILDKFLEHLNQNFEAFCDRHGFEKSESQFITFLIDQNLISTSHLQKYTILKEFEKILEEREQGKSKIVNTLAHRFSLSERSVWSMLKQTKPSK